MPGHQGAGGVFGIHLVAVAEGDANLGAPQQVQDGAVAREVGAGGVAIGIAGALVALGEEGTAGQILRGDTQFAADAGVDPLGVGLREISGEVWGKEWEECVLRLDVWEARFDCKAKKRRKCCNVQHKELPAARL